MCPNNTTLQSGSFLEPLRQVSLSFRKNDGGALQLSSVFRLTEGFLLDPSGRPTQLCERQGIWRAEKVLHPTSSLWQYH